MKKLLPILLCCACTPQPRKAPAPPPAATVTTQAPAPALPPSDTVFLRRSLDAGIYQAVFIDPAENSAARRTLMNFEFRQSDQEAYEADIKAFPPNYKQQKTLGLPEKWLPLYQYQNEYFLYAPSDWGNAGRRLIRREAYVVWDMEGPTPFYWHAIRQTDKHRYELRYQGYNAERKIILHILDPKTQLAVFEYQVEPGSRYIRPSVSQTNTD